MAGIKSPPATLAAAPGLLLSAVQRPLSGWMVSAPGCTDGARVGGQRGGLVELQALHPREPLEAHAWAASQFSFLDLPINYFLGYF